MFEKKRALFGIVRHADAGNDGATMLSKIKEIDSEVVTVLLTGHTDFELR